MSKLARIFSVTLLTVATSVLVFGQDFTLIDSPRFEENKGQFSGDEADQIKFRIKSGVSSVFLLENAISYQFSDYENLSELIDVQACNLEKIKKLNESTYRMDIELVGANENPRISKYDRSDDFVRYSWLDMKEIYFYSKIIYHEVYNNIDWVFYINDEGIKYEFVVRPGGNPTDIVLQSKWVEHAKIDELGNLHLANRLGSVRENKPVSFQNDHEIMTNFVLDQDKIRFELEKYDSQETLIIDPQIVWGSYYGGDGSDALYAVTSDNQGNVYACGTTYGSNNLASGGFLNSNPAQFGGAGAAYLVKFDQNGTRLWATYYGGPASFSGSVSCQTDSQDNVYLAGFTLDNSGIAFNGHQNVKGGSTDAFLVKFNPAGQRIWATYFGGAQGESGLGLSIDPNDNIYLTGRTFSDSMIAFNGFQNTPSQDISLFGDAFLSKFDSLGTLLWSTYYGGEMGDRAFSVACSANGECYIAGGTRSTSGIASNGHQSTFGSTNSAEDAFLAKYSDSGALLWSTYYGGTDKDIAFSCAVDDLGNVFMSGQTVSPNNIFFNGFQNTGTFNAGASFLAKFNASGTR
ncbi:MAG: SBBP repeat-containing protein, partial [Crocinitomicaceae bacterium]